MRLTGIAKKAIGYFGASAIVGAIWAGANYLEAMPVIEKDHNAAVEKLNKQIKTTEGKVQLLAASWQRSREEQERRTFHRMAREFSNPYIYLPKNEWREMCYLGAKYYRHSFRCPKFERQPKPRRRTQ